MNGPIDLARAFDADGAPDADLLGQCVHCGFCLTTCPTYDLGRVEMDSPRGRTGADGGGARARQPAHPRDGRALRQLPRLHGLRHGLPVGGPVRQADPGHAGAGRAPPPAPAARARAQAIDLRPVHPPGTAAGDGAADLAGPGAAARPDRRAAAERLAPAGGARARALAAAERRGHQAAAAVHGPRRGPRAGRPAPGLRPARPLRGRQPRHGRGAGGGGLRRPRAAPASLLRGAAAARGRRAAGEIAGQGDDHGVRGLRVRGRQRRRLRLGAQGLRAPAARRARLGRSRRRVLVAGPRRQRAAGRAGDALAAPPGAAGGRLPRRLPPRARSGDPRGAAPPPRRDPRRSSWPSPPTGRPAAARPGSTT